MSKLTLILAVVLTSGALVSGTALLGHGAMGRWGFPRRRRPRQNLNPRVRSEPKGSRPIRLSTAPEPLSPNAKARLDAAKKIRDSMYRLYQGGQIDELSYLNAQRRYDDTVGELTVKSDLDRVRFNEVRVAGLKQIEQTGQGKSYANGGDIGI